MATRRNFRDQIKMALGALHGDKTVQEIAAINNCIRTKSAQTPDNAYWAGLEEKKAA